MRFRIAVALVALWSSGNTLFADSPVEPPIPVLPMPTGTIDPAPVPAAPFHSITLRDAIAIASSQGIDALLADRSIDLATAQYQRARGMWLPNISSGTDYFYHSGVFQNSQGPVGRNIRQSFMYGFGWNAIVPLTDAIYEPRAARNLLQATASRRITVDNDVALGVAEAYFTVLQYYGESVGAREFVAEAQELVRQVSALSEGLVPALEINRARVELARRKQVASAARERYRFALADLARYLRFNPGQPLMPVEPANLKIQLIDSNCPLDELIPIALTNRPELATQQALTQAAIQRLKAEKIRPLVPSFAFRSVSTNPSGTLGVGSFAAGGSAGVGGFGGRFDYDVQVIWELQNLGLGNYYRVKERRTEHESAVLETLRVQDRIATEVAQAHSALTGAVERLLVAEPAFDEARELLKKNVEGLTQTRRVGNLLTPVVRPQEVVAALQSLGQANADYFAAVADFNRAQFRLYRALGHPISAAVAQLP